MTRRASPTLTAALALAVLLPGCARFTEDVDRPAYYAARDAVAAAFPAPDTAPPPFLSEVPGLPVTDAESAARAILTRAGVPADPVPLTAARFMARQVADPERLCGPVAGDPMADLMTPEISADWRAALAADGTPYTIFFECERPGLPVQVTDIRILSASVLTASQRPGYGGVGISIDVDVGYLLRRADGITPYIQTREAFLYVEPVAPYRLSGPISLNWTSGPGLGEHGVPNPEAFAPAGDRSAADVGVGEAPAAAAVLQALAGTLEADAVAMSLRRQVIGGEADEDLQIVETGSLYPRSGAAEATIEGGEAIAQRVIAQTQVFSNYPEPFGSGPDEGKTWALYDTSRAPQSWQELPSSDNPFSIMNWIAHLAAATSTSCERAAAACYTVQIPTTAILTPGTPGYRDAAIHAARGNQMVTFEVAVESGRLTGVEVDYSFAGVHIPDRRIIDSWTFSDYRVADPPVLAPPEDYAEE